MFPKITNGSVDVQLTNVLLAYTNPQFLVDQILPVVPNLKKESGLIPEMGNAHMRIYSSKRSLYDEGQHRVNFTINNTKRYDVEYHDLSAYVPDRLQEQLDSPFDARKAAQFTVADAMQLEREAALAALMTDTSILTNNVTLSGEDQYSDGANSDPDDDFKTARTTIQLAIGREANAVYMSRAVANALMSHPFFLEIGHSRLQGGGAVKSLSMSAFVEVLKARYELDYVFIGKTIKISSQEGQTETKASVWGDDVVFFYRPTSPSLFTPSFGYSFQLQGYMKQTRVRREMKEDKGDIVEVIHGYQDNILDANAAYLIKDAV